MRNHASQIIHHRAEILAPLAALIGAIILGTLIMGIARAEVNSEISGIHYTGNGSAKTFTFPFGILSTSELRVVLRTVATGAELLLILNSDYSMADDDGDGDYTDGPGGSITTLGATAYSSAYEIWITRKPALTQTADIDGTGYLRLAALEDSVDKLTYEVQYLRRLLYRVPLIPETEAQAVDMNVPNSVNRASAFLKFTAAGSLTTATTTEATMTGFWSARVAADADAAAARAGLVAQGSADHWIDLYEPAGSGVSRARITVPAMTEDQTWTWPDHPGAGGWLAVSDNGHMTVEVPAGGGDMLAATYDTDANGVIDEAESAQHATFAENVDDNDYGEVAVSGGAWTVTAWHASSATVFNTKVTASSIYQDLDLSATVGSNAALVFLQVYSSYGGAFACHAKGTGSDFAHEINATLSAQGSGVAAVNFNEGAEYRFIVTPTSATGIIQIAYSNLTATLTIKVLGYLK